MDVVGRESGETKSREAKSAETKSDPEGGATNAAEEESVPQPQPEGTEGEIKGFVILVTGFLLLFVF